MERKIKIKKKFLLCLKPSHVTVVDKPVDNSLNSLCHNNDNFLGIKNTVYNGFLVLLLKFWYSCKEKQYSFRHILS